MPQQAREIEPAFPAHCPPALLRYNWHATLYEFKASDVLMRSFCKLQTEYHDIVSYLLRPRHSHQFVCAW